MRISTALVAEGSSAIPADIYTYLYNVSSKTTKSSLIYPKNVCIANYAVIFPALASHRAASLCIVFVALHLKIVPHTHEKPAPVRHQ